MWYSDIYQRFKHMIQNLNNTWTTPVWPIELSIIQMPRTNDRHRESQEILSDSSSKYIYDEIIWEAPHHLLFLVSLQWILIHIPNEAAWCYMMMIRTNTLPSWEQNHWNVPVPWYCSTVYQSTPRAQRSGHVEWCEVSSGLHLVHSYWLNHSHYIRYF